MDLPPFHHRRYQPFSDTSTDSFYCPQPHSLRPPPPLPSPLLPPLPPPPSSTILPLAPQPPPPPPIPSPSQSQFSFRHNPTIEERSLQLPNFIPSHILHQHRPPLRPPSPTRVSSYHHSSRSQQLRFEDNSRFSDPWTDMPLLPRLRAEPSLRHVPTSPLSPHTGSYSNDFQSGLRFRDEYRDEGFRGDVSPQLPLWGRKETRFDTRDDVDDREYRYGSGRERYKWNSDRGNRDFVSADSRGTTDFSWNQSRDFDLDIGHYNLYNHSEADVRCGISNMEAERGKYGNNSVHLRAERSELFENSGFQDLSRSNSNRVGEKRTDLFFSRSPRKKQLQKKSALQRIQLGKANNRNRNHDYSHFPKSYHDESNSVVGGSFKGKETDVHARLERKIEEREKSPVELDVLFKSNALIAKAIKATPSPIVDPNRNLMSRNRKIRKMNLSDSPGTGLSENLDGTESSTDPLVKDNQESANNAFADKYERSILVSHHSHFPNKSEKSTEKVSAIRTESCIFFSDIPSDTDKDHGQITKKTRVSLSGSLSSGGLEPFPSVLDVNTANNESPKSVESSQGVEVAASDGTIDGTPRKRKRIACPLQPKSDGHEQTSQDFPSADCPLQATPLDEGLSNSAGTSIVSTVASDFHTDLVDEKVKSSSQDDPNMKEHDTDINSSLLLLPQSSEMASASQNSQDAFVFCEAADHGETSVLHGISGLNFDKGVEHSFQEESVLFQNCPDSKVKNSVEVNAVKENMFHDSQTEAYTSGNEGCSTSGSEQRLCRMSIHDGYSGLNFDKGLEHLFQEELVLFQNGPGSNVRDSLEVNAAKENDIHDSQMEAYTSRNEGCFTLSFEQRLCRMSEKIDVADSKNANPQEFSPNQVTLLGANDIVEDSTDPVSCVGNIDNLCVSPSKFEAVPKENFASFNSTVALQLGSMGIASQGGTDDFVSLNGKAFSGDDSSQVTLPCRVNSASLPNNLSPNVDVSCIISTNAADRLLGSDSEALFNNVASSSEYVPSNLLLDMQNSRSSHSELSNGRSVKQKILTKRPVSVVDTVNVSSLSAKNDAKLGQGLTSSVNSQEKSLLSQNNPKVIQSSNTLPAKSSLSNSRLMTSILGGFPGHTSGKYPSVGEALPFKLVSRPRTWHRTGTSPQLVAGQKDHVASQINLHEEPGKVQNAYVRKGNSLVRKTYPVGAVPQRLHASASKIFQLRPGIDNLKKVGGSENDINISEPSTSATIGGFVIGPERPKTPPLIGTTKPLNCMPADLGDSTGSQADSFRKNCPGETLDPSNSIEIMDVRKCSKDAHASGIKEHEDERNSGKKITYVKQKSNQLVAFSNSSDPSFQRSEKPYPLSSDGYYKRRKNQLIRTSLEDKAEQLSDIPGKFLSPHRQEFSKKTLNRSSSKRQTGFTKKKFSLVWTLHDTLASKKEGKSGQFCTVRPFLFPWRRATYWTNFKPSLSSTSNDNLASSISRKLLLSRKCDTIYKRSLSGFSLRRSKVLGFRGRNLKWSKSIERNSKKANEDAELAVVAAEKRKSEQNGAAFTFFKSRNYVSRGRIFRIGSERYRMDPTGKTLQRISDEKSSYSENQSVNNAKKFFVPRRLLIGNDEYVRIGNGNQLVRDPKKRTRVLANEKIRWSLHTARLRLARKKKYCQFFTRFGKCNKDDKKCPYIHDPSKIVVCTKFLNGCCSDSNCKLTHKVIPERMQDCSYFLQGLCSNESCPYRHVNVNPNAPVCEGFLRGYCVDGNECRKKHTYVCPVFEETGNCHEVDKCKLHHPKTKKKGIKRKASMVQKNARGRYFGAQTIDIATNVTAVPNVIIGECDDQIFCQDGKFTDFISLADSGDAMEEAVEPRVELSCDSDRDEPSEMQVDLDELIKPVSLMKKTHVLDFIPCH